MVALDRKRARYSITCPGQKCQRLPSISSPPFRASTRERRLSAVGIVGARERETFYRLRLLEDASRADERARRRESPRAARTRAIRVAGLRYEMGENARRRIR